MNILVFSWRDPKHPLAGGAEQVMHEHMKGWIEAGHAVTLFSPRFKGSSKQEILDKVQIIREGYQYLGVQVLGFLHYLKNRNKYDFVVDQFHGLPFFTPLYVKKPRLAVIQEPAREVWLKNPLIFPVNYLVGAIGYFFEPLIFLFYKNTKFMTGSISAKHEVNRMGIPQKSITVVSHGVDLPRKMPIVQKNNKKTVVFLGILSKDKGVEDAIKCFSLLDENYTFWVIGKPETKRYEKYIMEKAKKTKKNIRFWGYVDKKKKFELLSKSHILVNPSIREGWGLVNIEANSVKTPVVSYKSPGLVDSVKDRESGLIVKKNTPEKLAQKIQEVLKSKKEYERLQQGAKKWSQQFSWKKSKLSSLKLINKILKD